MNKWLKWLLKIIITGAALFITFRKVNWAQTYRILISINAGWMLLAFLFYNLSQFFSAKRLLYFYHALPVPLDYRVNLKLYYVGMFYNLFLPGGIGGDGYKVHYLYKQYHQRVKKIITATLLDRVHGLVIMGLLIMLIAVLGTFPADAYFVKPIWIVIGYLAGLIIYLFIFFHFFKTYSPAIFPATFFSAAVQLSQLVAVICLLQGLHINDALLAYLLLFLLSSIAAVIPFTIGGMGARELVFISGAPLLAVSSTHAVAVSLLFFVLTAISALAGGFIKMKKNNEDV